MKIEVVGVMFMVYERFDEIGVVKSGMSGMIVVYEFGVVVWVEVIVVRIVILRRFVCGWGMKVVV